MMTRTYQSLAPPGWASRGLFREFIKLNERPYQLMNLGAGRASQD
jgi:hypothetical protein